jgi:hypothetical protein
MKIIFDHLHGHVKNDRVFCESFVLPEGETEDELLELGFLPNIQPPIYWYQAKSCRINNDKIKLSYKRKKLLSELEVRVFPYQKNNEEVNLFFQRYFQRKKFNLLNYYDNNSNFGDLKIIELKHNGEVVALTRFREFKKVLLGLETSFLENIPKFSLGKDAILALSNYGKTQSKNLLYIYESYENYFPYKLEITGCEYWEGEKWISTDI